MGEPLPVLEITSGVNADRSGIRVTRQRPGSARNGVNKAHLVPLDTFARGTFLDDVEPGTVPGDLALDAEGQRDAWDTIPFSTRRATLAGIKTAKRAPTRAARIAHTVAACRVGARPR